MVIFLGDGFKKSLLFFFCSVASAFNLSDGVSKKKYFRKYISCSSKDLNILILFSILKFKNFYVF